MKPSRMLPLLALCCVFTSSCARIGNRATVTEEHRTIKTYPFSDPDPVPILAKNRNAGIYPYFRFDGFAREGRDQEWKVVRLENRFIKVFVLPEAGGKIWGAVEKSTGKDFIYMNDVMKFRDIAMRGPWTSGGIEFNFGLIGHTPSTATPVDYITRENSDGSVSCIVGGMDLPGRTQWRVEIRLPMDAAEFETISSWYNPTPFQHPYYHWMNAAVHARNDLQFYYPGRYYIGHGGDVHPWPVDENGIDLSLYRNHGFGGHKSLHVLGSSAEFSAGYWHDLDLGFGHWSKHEDMPGRKIWIWSLARSGAIWEDLLTNTSGQYVEVQAGRQFSQAALSSGDTSPFAQAAFYPFAADTWSEIWFPIRKIGGVVDAGPDGALNVSQAGTRLRIGVNALKYIDTDLTVSAGNETAFKERLKLDPMQVYEKEITISSDARDVKVAVGNSLRWSSNATDSTAFSRPMVSPPEKTASTTEWAFLSGRQHELMRDYDKAIECYTDCLRLDPLHIQALVRLSEIYCRKAEYDKALSSATKALAIDTYDPDANFVFGAIHQSLGNWNDAIEALGWAARSPEYRSAAYAMIAEIHLTQKRFGAAAAYAQESLDSNCRNLSAMAVMALAQRKLGLQKAASQTLADIASIDPLNHFVSTETWFQMPSEDNRRRFISLIRSELPRESYLELALYYARLGQSAEAIQILELSPPYPIADYWLAYLTRAGGTEESRRYLQKATQASPRLVFPFRSETIPVLQWAANQEPNWKTFYYLGLLYWSKGRYQEASRMFADCGNTPDYGPFYLTRAEFFRATGRQNSEEDLKRALDLAPDEWRCWYALTRHYLENSELERAAATAKRAFDRFPANHILGLQFAKGLLDTRRYREALDLLAGLNVLPYENASEGHVLYERANLQLGLERIKDQRYEDALAFSARSRDWPEHLGAGKPYNPDERVQDWIESYCQGKLGKVPPRAFDKVSLEKLKQELKSSAPWKYELLDSLYR